MSLWRTEHGEAVFPNVKSHYWCGQFESRDKFVGMTPDGGRDDRIGLQASRPAPPDGLIQRYCARPDPGWWGHITSPPD